MVPPTPKPASRKRRHAATFLCASLVAQHLSVPVSSFAPAVKVTSRDSSKVYTKAATATAPFHGRLLHDRRRKATSLMLTYHDGGDDNDEDDEDDEDAGGAAGAEEDTANKLPHGIIMDKDHPDYESGTGRQFLIKWGNSQYSDSTYEFERDLILSEAEYEEHVKAFEARSAKPTKKEMTKVFKHQEEQRRRLYKIFGEKGVKVSQEDKIAEYQKKMEAHVFANGGQVRDYQAEGISWMISNYINNRSSILADEVSPFLWLIWMDPIPSLSWFELILDPRRAASFLNTLLSILRFIYFVPPPRGPLRKL